MADSALRATATIESPLSGVANLTPWVLRPVRRTSSTARAHDLALLHDDHDLVGLAHGQRTDQVAALARTAWRRRPPGRRGPSGYSDAGVRLARPFSKTTNTSGSSPSLDDRHRQQVVAVAELHARDTGGRAAHRAQRPRRWRGSAPTGPCARRGAGRRGCDGEAGPDELVAIAQVDGDEATGARRVVVARRVFLTRPPRVARTR